MNEWYAVRKSKPVDKFLTRNKEVKLISNMIGLYGKYVRIWVEDIYGNLVLFIVDTPDGHIRELRCYAPYDPSFILFLLVKHEGCQIMPEEFTMGFDRPNNDTKDKDYEEATSEFSLQIKKNKSYKKWLTKSYI